MFTIKVCGITNPSDAIACAAAGVDAVGLNFYPQSPRAIDISQASKILAALPASILKVGLFVNADAAMICNVFDSLKLDLIQLHGDEQPEYLAELRGRPVMKAFRVKGVEGLATIRVFLAKCLALKCPPRMILLDAPSGTGFGGSGKLADWTLAQQYQEIANAPQLVLAGGLTAENVAEAIQTTHVQAVDTASGVEMKPGIKDPAKVKAFADAASKSLLRSN